MIRDKILIFAFGVLVLLFSFGIVFRGQKEVSVIENRTLQKFPKLNYSKFLSDEYQENIESAFSDQFVFGQTIKKNFNKVNSFISMPVKEIIRKNSSDNDLIPMGSGIYEMGNTGYLVYPFIENFSEIESPLNNRISDINKIYNETHNVDFYVYKINKDVDIKIKDEIDEIFNKNLDENIKYMSSSYIKNINDYKNFYYKTDHHWNYKGSYAGYKDIIDLMTVNDNYIKVNKTICYNDIKYNGSKARKTGDFSLYDKFCVYDFSFPKHSVYINGKIGTYGASDNYKLGKYNKNSGINHYGEYYGGDPGLVNYIFENNTKKGNLLIISDSFSNAVNLLMASHFYKTYIIDLRYYKIEMGKDFYIEDFVKENNIKTVLFLGSISFYYSDEFKLNVE